MKKVYAFLTIFLVAISFAFAQQDNTTAKNNDPIYETPEEKAEFPGGEEVCVKWLSEQINYPQTCMEQGIQGRVIVSFIVNKDGTIEDTKIIRSPDPNLSREAERVIGLMPKWKPAMQSGKAVRSRYMIPLMFRLNTNDPQKPDSVNANIAANTPQVTLANSDDDRIYDMVETRAQFPGGEQACYKWIAEHQQYPVKAMEEGIQGRVMVSFVVNTDGSIGDIKVTRSPSPVLSKEAIRVVNTMPKWIPAKQGGKAVRSRFTIPVMFKLT